MDAPQSWPPSQPWAPPSTYRSTDDYSWYPACPIPDVHALHRPHAAPMHNPARAIAKSVSVNHAPTTVAQIAESAYFYQLHLNLRQSTRTNTRVMPPKRKTPASSPEIPIRGPLTKGAGMTAGLEIWTVGTQKVLVDRSADGRFAADVDVWVSAVGLNEETLNRLKDATK